MRRIYTSKNIDEFIGDGLKWDKKLPTYIAKKFDGKDITVIFDDYPCSKVVERMEGESIESYLSRAGGYNKHTVTVNSPKTFGDILKPYTENVVNLIQCIDNGSLKGWDYLHNCNNLWAEEFVFDGNTVSIEIGS